MCKEPIDFSVGSPLQLCSIELKYSPTIIVSSRTWFQSYRMMGGNWSLNLPACAFFWVEFECVQTGRSNLDIQNRYLLAAEPILSVPNQ